jgi:hypothetical protein
MLWCILAARPILTVFVAAAKVAAEQTDRIINWIREQVAREHGPNVECEVAEN